MSKKKSRAGKARPSSRPLATQDDPGPEATPSGISMDIEPPRMSTARLAVVEEAFFDGAAAAEAKLHDDAVDQLVTERAELSAPVRRITPEVMARRDRMKRLVLGVVGAASVLSAAALFRLATTSRSHGLDEHAQAQRAETPPPPAAELVDLAPSNPVVSPEAPDDMAKAPATTAATEPATSPAAPATSAIDPQGAKELTKKALRSLESGKYPAAIDDASASVAADPSDANAYLYWGTALLETGKRKDAKAVFARCLSDAKRGPKHECASFWR